MFCMITMDAVEEAHGFGSLVQTGGPGTVLSRSGPRLALAMVRLSAAGLGRGPFATPIPMPSVFDEFALCLHFTVCVYFPARPPVLHCRDVPRLQVIKIRAGRFPVVAPWLPGPWLVCFPSRWIVLSSPARAPVVASSTRLRSSCG